MEFYMEETRMLAKDGTPSMSSEIKLVVKGNNVSTSFDILVDTVKSVEVAKELIQPSNLMNNLGERLTEEEYDVVSSFLNNEPTYKFYDEEYNLNDNR